MTRRLFIAINFTEDVKEEIEDVAKRTISVLGNADNLRATLPEDLHITLLFLGDKSDESIIPIINSLRGALDEFPVSPLIEFDKVNFNPIAAPNMAWIYGTKETSENLSLLRKALENQLVENGEWFKVDFKKFNGHITLARFNNLTSQKTELIKLPQMDQISFYPKSVDLMESHLGNNKLEPRYEILARVEFKKAP